MPRNGAGVYGLPSGNPVVTGTAISSTTHNNTMSDIANAISQSLSADGQTTMSGNLPMGGFKVTGLGRGTGQNDAASLANIYALIGTDGTLSFRNRLRNGNFTINQRFLTGTVTLPAGAYGHDGWKAGAGGCTYTFAAGADTIITITSGSLMQPIEANLIEGGVYALSNRGTAQARIAVNGAATSGVYAAATASAPLPSASATSNQQVTVEFTTGTLDRVQLEPGTVATAFERRALAVELAICQRYYEIGSSYLVSYGASASLAQRVWQYFATPKRSPPSVTLTLTSGTATSPIVVSPVQSGFIWGVTSTAAGQDAVVNFTASAEI